MAVIEHAPAPVIVTVLPETVQPTDSADAAYVTGNSELAEAERVNDPSP